MRSADAAARIAIAEMLGAGAGEVARQQDAEQVERARVRHGDAEAARQGRRDIDLRRRALRFSVTGRCGTSGATKVPAPTLATAKPSEISISKQATAAERDRPKRWARSRVVGSLAPAASAPVSISRLQRRVKLAAARAVARQDRDQRRPIRWIGLNFIHMIGSFSTNVMAHGWQTNKQGCKP